MSILDVLNQMVSLDFLSSIEKKELYVGNLFELNYSYAKLITCDYYKFKVNGIPHGAFLLALYKGGDSPLEEAVLLRVVGDTLIPSEDYRKSTMEYLFEQNFKMTGNASLDSDNYTKFKLSISGLECRVLGMFYKDKNGHIKFGADVENYYSPFLYEVYKPSPAALEFIVNQGIRNMLDNPVGIFRIGKVRYTSSIKHQEKEPDVPVYISSKDFLGKRTALFGMTRTGKSNTVKMIIRATKEISDQALFPQLSEEPIDFNFDNGKPFAVDGRPKYKVGQLIFDINGEYANPNAQDEGTAISDMYKDDVVIYSINPRANSEVLRINFYKDLELGFSTMKELILSKNSQISDYLKDFFSITLEQPVDYQNKMGTKIRYDRKVAAYRCLLYKAGFEPPSFAQKVYFQGKKEINAVVGKDPIYGLSLEDACQWFEAAWSMFNEMNEAYKKNKTYSNDEDYFDDEMKAILRMLTQKMKPNSVTGDISGYVKIREIKHFHTPLANESYDTAILSHLRRGKIVIIDLSVGTEELQQYFSEKICLRVFQDALERFTSMKPNNLIQIYFEEAHNLFPRKDDSDLSQIYNRLAKEGEKLNIGIIYLTQEVSSISSNILKNTQNMFIAHLNNNHELRELESFYDFEDFSESLKKFSLETDVGFVKMKVASNSFSIPVQIDKFQRR